jgi:3-oxoacyl-[acyl-carrier protein] reductase
VVVNDVGQRAEDVAEEICSAGGNATPLLFDVTDFTDVSRAFSKLEGVDILINNAGNAGGGSFSLASFVDTQPEDWDPFIRVNLYGVLHCCRLALPSMIDRSWGRIVTIISESARSGEPKMATYSAAKAGAAGFGRSLAREVARHGITVNSVALGTIAVPGMTDPVGIEKLVRNYPIRRRGEPEDVAGIVSYLASASAAWVTGQTIPVNGGYSMAL